MKIFLVTRGSQGDIYPYLMLAVELMRRGHEITISLPQIFEKEAKAFDLNYVLQSYDDINGMIEGAADTSQKTGHLLKWVRSVVDRQFEEFIPILEKHDIFVSANTEFAAVSIAEYCKKPIIRTAFAPFIPGTQIPPPVMPWPKANPVFSPKFLWKLLNRGTDFMVRKTINKNRASRGMPPIENYGKHAAGGANNFLMYSRYLGSIDTTWTFKWDIGGYCFNDTLRYEEDFYEKLLSYIRKDNKPTVFFTLGSCNTKKRNQLCEWLLDICNKQGYKLIVGSGWYKTGEHLQNEDNLFLLDQPIPHSLVFPYCDAIIHHGGCGTTHNAGRAGRPQLIVSLIIDQHYWGNRVFELGVGPDRIKISSLSYKELKRKVYDLITNQEYKRNAAVLGEKIQSENGLQAACDYIETFSDQNI